jgi:hypothetical protein
MGCEGETMTTALHICKPRDTTRTLCEMKAAQVAAVNYSEFSRAHGVFCLICWIRAVTLRASEVEVS